MFTKHVPTITTYQAESRLIGVSKRQNKSL